MSALWAVGLFTLSIDALVWGIAADVLHRGFGGAPERWRAPAAVAALVFVVWDQWLFAAFVRLAGIPSSPELSASRAAEIGLEIVATLVGFRLGRALAARAARTAAESATRPAPPAAGPPASRPSPG